MCGDGVLGAGFGPLLPLGNLSECPGLQCLRLEVTVLERADRRKRRGV